MTWPGWLLCVLGWCARCDLMTSKECIRSTPSKRSFFETRQNPESCMKNASNLRAEHNL